MTASRLGLVANLMDSGSLRPRDFVSFAAAKWRHRTPALPEGYDEERDPLLLRNHHPPFVVYAIWPFSASTSEGTLRFGQTLGAAILLTLVAFAHLRLSPHLSLEGAAVVCLLGLWAARLGFASLHTHGWMAVWTTGFVLSLERWLSRPTLGWGLSCCASLALSLATLHSGVITAVGALLVLAVGGAAPGRARAIAAARGIVITVLGTLVLWPAGLLKIGYAKIFAVYAYLLLGRQEWSQASQVRGHMVIALLPVLLLGPLALAWHSARGTPAARSWTVPAVCGLLYAVVVARQLVAPWYALPALAPLIPFIGWWIDGQRRRLGRVALSCLVLALTLPSWLSQPAYDPGLELQERGDIAWLRDATAARAVLADNADVYRFYLSRARSVAALFVDYRGALVVRERGSYRPAVAGDFEGRDSHRPHPPRRDRSRSVAGLRARPSADCPGL